VGTSNAARGTGATGAARHGSTAHLAPAASPARTAAKPPPKPPSRSVGSPTQGQLVSGSRLGDAPYLRIYPVYAGNDARWGLDSLVSLIDRAGKSVRQKFPDAVLSVGHLSRAGGGELDRHASHESGRDADIGFYVKNAAGKPVYGDHMVAFQGDGSCSAWPGAHFDDARNWALVAAILSDPGARVTHMFVATPIRRRLLAYAEKIGAPPAIRTRAAEVLAQPHGALPHDDHFHVRIACPAGSDKCVELPLAKRHGSHGSAVASHHGHPAHPSSHASSQAGAIASHDPVKSQGRPGAPHAAPDPRAGSASASNGPATSGPATPPVDAHGDDETAKADSFVPSLAPIVPGLDSVVIPKPLEMPSAPSKDPPSRADVVSDPDGALER